MKINENSKEQARKLKNNNYIEVIKFGLQKKRKTKLNQRVMHLEKLN
jgi:hypothetical protein